MSEEEKTRIGDLVLRKKAASRRLDCHRDKAKSMIGDMESAIRLLKSAIDGSNPIYVELPGFPDREDVEQVLSGISRELDTIHDLNEKLDKV